MEANFLPRTKKGGQDARPRNGYGRIKKVIRRYRSQNRDLTN